MLAAAGELRANGVDGAVRASLADLDARSGHAARRSAGALGTGSAFVIAVCGATAALMVAVSAPGVAAGLLPGEIAAVLILLPLGLIDPLLGVVDGVQRAPVLLQALRRIARFTAVLPTRSGGRGITTPVSGIALQHLAAGWPDASEPAFDSVNATVSAGEWLVVTGPSGSGKSTLLSVLFGYLEPASGRYLLGADDSRDLDPTQLRRHIAWCPQDGHLFDSTLRANLLLARSRADAPSDADMLDALARAGLARVVDALPQGLDTRVGSEGSRFSGRGTCSVLPWPAPSSPAPRGSCSTSRPPTSMSRRPRASWLISAERWRPG